MQAAGIQATHPFDASTPAAPGGDGTSGHGQAERVIRPIVVQARAGHGRADGEVRTGSRWPRAPLVAALATGVVAGALAGAVAGALVVYQGRSVQPAPQPATVRPSDGQAAALAGRVTALDERLMTVGRKVDELATARIAPLEAAAGTTSFRLAALGRRLDHVQDDLRRLGDVGPQTLPAAIAVLQLKTRVDGGGPFAAEMALVRQFVADTPDTAPSLAVLAVGAERGVPTAVDLREGFLRLAPLLLEQAGRADSSLVSWGMQQSQQALAFLGFADTPPEHPVRIAVAEARRALDRSQVATAAAAFDRIDGVAGAIASGWLAAARLRIATDHSVDLLLGRTTRRMVEAQ